jgi:hypothetical protein
MRQCQRDPCRLALSGEKPGARNKDGSTIKKYLRFLEEKVRDLKGLLSTSGQVKVK